LKNEKEPKDIEEEHENDSRRKRRGRERQYYLVRKEKLS
jgi:hypothetical protein